MTTTVVRGGTIATVYGVFKADILIRDGAIAALTSDAGDLAAGADETIDAAGLTILPGGVDPHTHLREPSRLDREGFHTGTTAAAGRPARGAGGGAARPAAVLRVAPALCRGGCGAARDLAGRRGRGARLHRPLQRRDVASGDRRGQGGRPLGHRRDLPAVPAHD